MKRINRREILGSLGALPFLGMTSSSKAKSQDKIDAVTGPTFITKSDKLDYARLKALDLNDPEAAAKQKKALRNNLWVKIEGIAFGEAV